MDTLLLALLIKPLAILLVAVLILIPVRLAVIRWWPDGKVKRFLLR